MSPHRPTTTTGAPARLATPLEVGHVACPYCSHGILAIDFTPRTGRARLLSADCECGRTVTMADATLHRRTVS